MRITVSSSLVAAILLATAGSYRPRAETSQMGNARTLYAQTSYEEALVQLNGIKDADIANQVHQYRALCLMALGRDREAQASLERIVVRAPRYVVPADDASPKMI